MDIIAAPSPLKRHLNNEIKTPLPMKFLTQNKPITTPIEASHEKYFTPKPVDCPVRDKP